MIHSSEPPLALILARVVHPLIVVAVEGVARVGVGVVGAAAAAAATGHLRFCDFFVCFCFYKPCAREGKSQEFVFRRRTQQSSACVRACLHQPTARNKRFGTIPGDCEGKLPGFRNAKRVNGRAERLDPLKRLRSVRGDAPQPSPFYSPSQCRINHRTPPPAEKKNGWNNKAI